MRQFVKIRGGKVIAESHGDHRTEKGMVEVTAQYDGQPYLGRSRNADGSFSAPLPLPGPTAEELEEERLIAKDPATYTASDRAKLMRLVLRRLRGDR